MEYKRLLNLETLLLKKSYFLFGPRATGKSFLIQKQLTKNVLKFDLLDDDIYTRFLKRPRQLGEEIGESNLIVIDEIQKLPHLLDEVHRLIETKKKKFLLTGSSARKLKRGGANLLAGRARNASMFPLTSREIEDFDLLRYINIGGLPAIYTSDEPLEDLKSYVNNYLKEEIQNEALVRRFDHYAKFLDTIGLISGQEINMSRIAEDSGVPPRTVANFLEILQDTLLAFQLLPFEKTKKRKASTKSKIFLFDVGVANFLSGRKNILPKTDSFGYAFEHFIIQEIRAILSYQKCDEPLFYWRSNDYEVDLIIKHPSWGPTAIEIKSRDQINDRHLKGLKALREEGIIKKFMIVSQDPINRNIDGIEAIHYEHFLKKLSD